MVQGGKSFFSALVWLGLSRDFQAAAILDPPSWILTRAQFEYRLMLIRLFLCSSLLLHFCFMCFALNLLSDISVDIKVHLTLKIFSPSNKSCYHSRYFIRRFNWPRDHYVTANNCPRIIACSCALRCEVVLLRIILLVRS